MGCGTISSFTELDFNLAKMYRIFFTTNIETGNQSV